jgi:glycine cleavage system H protein
MDKKVNAFPAEERHPLIPPKDIKCVWVTAGLLAYKLCKYDFECERCPLDWELRNLSLTPSSDFPALKEKRTEPIFREDLSLFHIKESLFYHPGHTWIKVERADEVRVGLDPFLGSIIGKVNVVVLPLSGRRGVRGEALCSVIQEEGILRAVFPVSGLILSVNPRLKDHPELVCDDPLGEGYLMTLKPKNLQRDQKYLFFGETAFSWYQKEWERFKEAVTSELHQDHDRVGVTMQDGGMALKDIKKLISPGRYIQLVNTFLRKGETSFFQTKSKRDLSLAFQPG